MPNCFSGPFTAVQIIAAFFCFRFLVGCAQPEAQVIQSIIAEGAVLQQIASEYAFTEGPAVDQAGNVYFTDQPNDRILKWSADGEFSVFMENAGRSNGLYFDHDGNLLACADAYNELWSINMDGEATVLIDAFEGMRFNGPNDLWVDADGGIYFTDPFYRRDYWTWAEKEIDQERLYYLSPNRQHVSIAADQFVRPNGLIGTPDGKTLYVADIEDKKTYAFDIEGSGRLTNRRLFTAMGSDGMTLDNQGNVYLTGNGVTVFNATGEQIEHIPVDEAWTANLTFGDINQETLFITAMGSIYTLAMNVRGVR